MNFKEAFEQVAVKSISIKVRARQRLNTILHYQIGPAPSLYKQLTNYVLIDLEYNLSLIHI